LASNIGTWMQNVGASWLMTTLTMSPLLVALMQTATSLPVFLIGLPAGAVADVADRRKLLLVTQGWMLFVAIVLGILTIFNLITAELLLLLTFLLGLGAAMNAPAWQAIVPELVGRRLVASAVALNSAGFNLARAVGPAIGGVIVAASGPGAVFMLNAASYLGVLVVLFLWRRAPVENPGPPERVMEAIAAGMRFARHSPSLQAVLVRAAVFIVPASGLWALLPVVARADMGLDAGGYGLLLGSLGIGAVIGALIIGRLNRAMSPDRLTVMSTLCFAVATVALGYVHILPLLVVLLALGGVAWMATMSSLNVSAQSAAPNWVRARALGVYLLVFQGGMALGSFGWGVVANLLGNTAALTIAAVGLVLSVAAAWRWRLKRLQTLDLTPAERGTELELAFEPQPEDGPVLVTIEYDIDPEHADDFVTAMQRVERMRRRTGSSQWGLFQDPSNPDRYLETFVARTWAEHMRQHTRGTVTDRRIEDAALSFQRPGTTPRVSHLIAAHPERPQKARQERTT
jgi:predicted MFS family arabinose efflux permease